MDLISLNWFKLCPNIFLVSKSALKIKNLSYKHITMWRQIVYKNGGHRLDVQHQSLCILKLSGQIQPLLWPRQVFCNTMSSLLCVKQPGGQLQIHNNDAIEELMIDSQDHITTMVCLATRYCLTRKNNFEYFHNIKNQSLNLLQFDLQIDNMG